MKERTSLTRWIRVRVRVRVRVVGCQGPALAPAPASAAEAWPAGQAEWTSASWLAQHKKHRGSRYGVWRRS